MVDPERARPIERGVERRRNRSQQSDQPADAQERTGSRQKDELNRAADLLPSISAPKGGGAIRGIGEKFAGQCRDRNERRLRFRLPLSPGRSGFTPQLVARLRFRRRQRPVRLRLEPVASRDHPQDRQGTAALSRRRRVRRLHPVRRRGSRPGARRDAASACRRRLARVHGVVYEICSLPSAHRGPVRAHRALDRPSTRASATGAASRATTSRRCTASTTASRIADPERPDARLRPS